MQANLKKNLKYRRQKNKILAPDIPENCKVGFTAHLIHTLSMAQSISLLQVDVKKGKTVRNLMDTPFPALDEYADA